MPEQSERVFLSAGSNLGNREATLEAALEVLRICPVSIKRVSSYYETEPVGFRDQPWFLNNALELETLLTPEELLAQCVEIEGKFGRVRSFRNAPRALDLDILLFGERVICEGSLEVPHPRMAGRRFVLLPLVEIAPEVVHPVLKRTMKDLLSDCPDTSIVRPY